MTQFLPPNLLALFAPRDPLPFLPPVEKLPHEKNSTPYSGIAQFINQFENPKDTPPPTRVETSEEKKERKRKERAEQVAYKLEQDLALWDPSNDTNIYGDPYKTLFVARINFDSSESKLRREFDQYGPVRKVHLIMDGVSGKPRGYAFIEFEHERDMHSK
jgi:U1 small nuclear ribonucleoprotein